MKAVRFDRYGDIDVLEVREVDRPPAAPGRVVVRVKAAGINPGEAKIRQGLLHARFPATFPSGEGSDLAGVVAEVGHGVGNFRPGDEVFGFTNERASHAEFASVPAEQLAPRPAGVPWEVAGSLFVAGTTAHAGVRAVALREGDTVAISGAAGGVGAIAVQLAKRLGVTVLGIAGPDNDAWLSAHGAIPVNHGPDLARRLLKAAPDGRIDAFLDLFGSGYLDLAIDELKIPPARANTTIDFAAASRLGAQAIGSAEAASVQTLNELATLIVAGELDVPIAATYPLADIQQAFRTLEEGHTRGKIVLLP